MAYSNGKGEPVLLFVDPQGAATSVLVKKKSFKHLVWRLLVSDYNTDTILPLLIRYKSTEKNISIDDDFAKIHKSIGKKLEDAKSLAAAVYGTRTASGILADGLRAARWIKSQPSQADFELLWGQ